MGWRLVAGGVAGFLAQGASYPLHVVRRRMQVQDLMGGEVQYTSVRNALFTILRTEGLVKGLYKGGSLTLVKGPISASVGFAANDLLKAALASAHPDPERCPPAVWTDGPEVVRDSTKALKQMSPFEHLMCGGAAGAMAKSVIAPADRVKILYQTNAQRLFSWRAVARTFTAIYRNTGPAGLWRGHCATLLQVVPKSAITYMTFDAYRQQICQVKAVDNVTARFIAGACAGATATSLTYPLDLMRARMAAHWDINPRYPNYFGAFKAVIKEEGALALFRGIRPTLLGIMPYAGLSFMAYETLKVICRVPSEPAPRPDLRCTYCRRLSRLFRRRPPPRAGSLAVRLRASLPRPRPTRLTSSAGACRCTLAFTRTSGMLFGQFLRLRASSRGCSRACR